MIFIVVEGSDAVGKHTQTERLKEHFNRLGIPCVLYSFPRYDLPVGQAIKRHLTGDTTLADITGDAGGYIKIHADDPLVFQGMMLIDKSIAGPEIRSKLKQGTVVIADRWWHSAWAYGGADGLDSEDLIQMHQSLPQADLHVLLDLDPSVALERRPKARDRYEKDRDKIEMVRERYRNFWNHKTRATDEDNMYAIVDASREVDEVEATIWTKVVDAVETCRTLEESYFILNSAIPETRLEPVGVDSIRGRVMMMLTETRENSDATCDYEISLLDAYEWAQRVQKAKYDTSPVEITFSLWFAKGSKSFKLAPADAMRLATQFKVLTLRVQEKVEQPELRAYTPDEILDKLMTQFRHMVVYWDTTEPVGTALTQRTRLSGLLHSILATLDGSGIELPAFDLIVCSNPEDEGFHRGQGENWYADGTVISTSLHDHLYTPEGKKQMAESEGAPSDAQKIAAWLEDHAAGFEHAAKSGDVIQQTRESAVAKELRDKAAGILRGEWKKK